MTSKKLQDCSLYPCLYCKEDCYPLSLINVNKPIQCLSCDKWVHIKCVTMSSQDLPNITDCNYEYYCNKCILTIFPFNNLRNTDITKLSYNSSINTQCKQFDCNSKQYIDINTISNKISNCISIYFFNIRSINRNFEELYEFVAKLAKKPHIICLSETWLNNKRVLTDTLPNYKFLPGETTSNSGGVALFVHNQIQYKTINMYNLNVDQCEDIWVELKLPSNKILILGTIYRLPNYNFKKLEDKLTQKIQLLNSNNHNYIIGWDININYLNNSKNIDIYKNNIVSLGCSQIINSPTRVSQQSATLIDHIYTNLLNNEIKANIIIDNITDHFPILVTLKQVKPPKQLAHTQIIQDFSKFNEHKFLKDLEQKLSNREPYTGNAEKNWKEFETIFRIFIKSKFNLI